MDPITQQQQATAANLNHDEEREAVMTQVIKSLPGLLAKCEDFQAAAIVAGLLKTHTAHRSNQAEPVDDELDSIIRKAHQEAARDSEYAY